MSHWNVLGQKRQVQPLLKDFLAPWLLKKDKTKFFFIPKKSPWQENDPKSWRKQSIKWPVTWALCFIAANGKAWPNKIRAESINWICSGYGHGKLKLVVIISEAECCKAPNTLISMSLWSISVATSGETKVGKSEEWANWVGWVTSTRVKSATLSRIILLFEKLWYFGYKNISFNSD